MSQHTKTLLPSAQQIATQINGNFNGFSSLAQAVIDVIRDYDLPDAAVMYLYRSIKNIKFSHGSRSIKHVKDTSASAWLPTC